MPVALLTPMQRGTRSGTSWLRAARTRSRGFMVMFKILDHEVTKETKPRSTEDTKLGTRFASSRFPFFTLRVFALLRAFVIQMPSLLILRIRLAVCSRRYGFSDDTG